MKADYLILVVEADSKVEDEDVNEKIVEMHNYIKSLRKENKQTKASLEKKLKTII